MGGKKKRKVRFGRSERRAEGSQAEAYAVSVHDGLLSSFLRSPALAAAELRAS